MICDSLRIAKIAVIAIIAKIERQRRLQDVGSHREEVRRKTLAEPTKLIFSESFNPGKVSFFRPAQVTHLNWPEPAIVLSVQRECFRTLHPGWEGCWIDNQSVTRAEC